MEERRFLRAAARYRITNHKCNGDIREELGRTCINAVIIVYQKNWLAFARAPEIRSQTVLSI